MPGANLWITGRNEEKLKDTAKDAKALGAGEVVVLKVILHLQELLQPFSLYYISILTNYSHAMVCIRGGYDKQ